MVGETFLTRLGSPYKVACWRIPKRTTFSCQCNFVATWPTLFKWLNINFTAEKNGL